MRVRGQGGEGGEVAEVEVARDEDHGGGGAAEVAGGRWRGGGGAGRREHFVYRTGCVNTGVDTFPIPSRTRVESKQC